MNNLHGKGTSKVPSQQAALPTVSQSLASVEIEMATPRTRRAWPGTIPELALMTDFGITRRYNALSDYASTGVAGKGRRRNGGHLGL